MYRKLILSATLFLFSLFVPFYAHAHPIDEIDDVNVYDQKQYLTISPATTTLKIDLTFYALEKMKVWASINKDNDQIITQKEKDAWIKIGSDSSWLEKEGKKYEFTPKIATIPNFEDFFSTKPVDISLEFSSNVQLGAGDKVKYVYKGKDKRLENIHFEVIGQSGITVSGLENLQEDSATFSVLEGSQVTAQLLPQGTSDRLNQFLNTYVKVENLSAALFLTSLAVSFAIGMLHALTPGHGKAIVAGYLVGEKGTISHAINLGLIITITHTFSVFLLGMGALILTEYVVPEVVIKWMTLISGILVTLFGIYLILTRTARFQKQSHHSHSEFDEMVHNHENGHKHNHDPELSWKNLIPLGISGGLVPCVDALAILIVAISLGKIILGLTLLIAFSAGLAFALIVGGIIVVVTKNKALKKMSKVQQYERYSSLISAFVVTILGLALILGQPL